jgi:hypothetical protein
VEVGVGASITDTTLLSEEHGSSVSHARTDCQSSCVPLRRLVAHNWSLQPSRNSRGITPVQARAGPDPLRKLLKMSPSRRGRHRSIRTCPEAPPAPRLEVDLAHGPA